MTGGEHERAYTWHDKSEWGDGPWQHEPDRVEWYAGDVPCLAVRNHRTGNWCGYAAVPPGHPWHGKDFTYGFFDVRPDVHGGVTFSEACMSPSEEVIDLFGEAVDPRQFVCHVPREGAPDDVWWLGFDCGHSFDRMPAFEARERKLFAAEPPDRLHEHRHYWTIEAVRNEVNALATQIVVAGS